VLANSGIHIAGTDFDKKLSISAVMPLLGMGSLVRGSSSDIEVPAGYYFDLTTWHLLSNLYDAKTISHVRSIQTVSHEKHLIERLIQVLRKRAGHHILDSVEKAKHGLSETSEVRLGLDFIEDELSVMVERRLLNDIIEDPLQAIIKTLEETVMQASVKFEEIDAIFYTGGSTKIPVIREKITKMFPKAEVIQGDAFGSVGLGLTLDAARKFG
jgi:hypothetical chaperone protein